MGTSTHRSVDRGLVSTLWILNERGKWHFFSFFLSRFSVEGIGRLS